VFSFREAKVSDAQLILDWRSKDRITKFMMSDIEYNINSQKKWLQDSLNRPDKFHWIINYNGLDIGLISIIDYKPDLKETTWGYYIGEDSALGKGWSFPPFFYNFVFDRLGIEEIKAWVFYDNLQTIKMHLMHGYIFSPSANYVIKKNGQDILIICLILMKDDFKSSKYARFKKDFPMSNWSNRIKI